MQEVSLPIVDAPFRGDCSRLEIATWQVQQVSIPTVLCRLASRKDRPNNYGTGVLELLAEGAQCLLIDSCGHARRTASLAQIAFVARRACRDLSGRGGAIRCDDDSNTGHVHFIGQSCPQSGCGMPGPSMLLTALRASRVVRRGDYLGADPAQRDLANAFRRPASNSHNLPAPTPAILTRGCSHASGAITTARRCNPAASVS
jgi:hypothetical protein